MFAKVSVVGNTARNGRRCERDAYEHNQRNAVFFCPLYHAGFHARLINFSWLHHTPPVAFCRLHPLRSLYASTEIDRAYCAARRASQHGKKILSQTKIALHRTRLRFLDHKNFSVLFFYKPPRRAVPALATLRKPQTEKIERNFSVFQFYGSKTI